MKALIFGIYILAAVAIRQNSADGNKERNLCARQLDGSTLPVDGECERFYYCYGQSAIKLACSDRMHFDSSKGICVDSKLSSCSGFVSAVAFKDGLTGNECYGKPTGEHIPYPGDCTKYLVCQWNSGTVMNCPDGLYFNAKTHDCDWPTSSGCIQGNGTPSTTTPSTTTSSTTTPSTPTSFTTTPSSTTPSTTTPSTTTPSTTTPSTTTSSTATPSDLTPTLPPGDDVCSNQAEDSLHPYPYDCAWYIKCEDGVPTVLPCEDGWLFNPILSICDYPDSVHCIASPYPTTTPSISTPATKTTTTSVTSTSPYPTTTSSLSTPSTKTTTVSPSTAFPYPTTTPKLPTPATKTTTTTSSPSSTSPYPTIKTTTVSPSTALPYPTTTPKLPTPATKTTTTMSSPSSTSPYPTIKTTTVSSSTAFPYPTTTPSDSTTADSQTSPAFAPTLEPNTDICSDQEDETYLPYPYDCAWYIECIGGKSVVLPCKNGWLFNPILQICDYPESVNCVASPYPTTRTPSLSTTTSRPTTVSPSTPATKTTTVSSSTPTYSTTTPLLSTPATKTTTTSSFSSTSSPYPTTTPAIKATTTSSSGPTTTPLPTTTPSLSPPATETTTVSSSTSAKSPYPATTLSLPASSSTTSHTSSITTSSPNPITPNTPAPGYSSGICANYPLNALIPYPGICSQYIRCELPVPLALECMDGLEFNAKLKLCEPPEEAGCSVIPTTTTIVIETTTSTSSSGSGMTGICRGYEEGDRIPYPGDCSKYIICENPIPIAQRCSPGLQFNPDLSICEEDADCRDDNNPSTIDPPQTTTRDPNIPGMTGVCANRQEGDLVPYPGSCTKYIRCEYPIPIAQKCKANQHFNEALGICDTPDSANCPSYTTTTPNPEEVNTVSPPSTTPKPPTFNGICHGYDEGDKIPYPRNCSKFIICESPIPIAIACQEGLHFNAELQICEDPAAAGCDETPTTTPAPSGGNVCCGHPAGTLLPYPDDCSQYIQCEYPVPIVLSCDNGLHFSSASRKCEATNEANCEWYVTTTIVPLTCDTEPDGTMLPFDGDCKRYNYCRDGMSVPLPCPGGTIFSPEADNCVQGTKCPN